MWRTQQIAKVGESKVLAPTSVTLSQQHGGFITKKADPYLTILRARPKNTRDHFERFIVLGDANTKHVEERLGNALLFNQVISKMGENEESKKNIAVNYSESINKVKTTYTVAQ